MLRPARAGRGGLRVGRRARCRQKLGLGLSPLEDRWSNCLFFMIAAGYQPPLANVATQPPWRRPAPRARWSAVMRRQNTGDGVRFRASH